MSRRTKFKVWDKTAKRWLPDKNFVIHADGRVEAFLIHDIRNLELVRYADSHDCHGIDIYEGDILKELAGTKPAPSFRQREVIFEDGCFMAYDPDNRKAVRLSELKPENIEIMGSKHGSERTA